MPDDKPKHTPESVAAKVVKALLTVKPTPKARTQSIRQRQKKRQNKSS